MIRILCALNSLVMHRTKKDSVLPSPYKPSINILSDGSKLVFFCFVLLLNLLNALGKSIKCEACQALYRFLQ